MRSGELRHRITFQQVPAGPDAHGDANTNWTDVYTTWASIEPLSGREQIAAAAVRNATTHRITFRFNPAHVVNAGMRVKFGTRFFNIVSPPRNTEERGREMTMDVQEGLKNG